MRFIGVEDRVLNSSFDDSWREENDCRYQALTTQTTVQELCKGHHDFFTIPTAFSPHDRLPGPESSYPAVGLVAVTRQTSAAGRF